MATLLAIIAFIALPALTLAAIITFGVILLRLFWRHVIPNAGKLEDLDRRLSAIERRLKEEISQ